jgi:16S rRNA (guanine527-N7)-methyltransferase
MTEEEAQEWIGRELNVPRETMGRLQLFCDLLREENKLQNLVSKASIENVWQRHILDSAQLLRFRPKPAASWIDLGTGAGFPGLIVAALHEGEVTLVEERRLRIDFLARAAALLEVQDRTRIIGSKVERLPPGSYDVISARAFAPLERLLALAAPLSTNETIWILPKGRNAQAELDAARSSWQGDFRIEPSLTDDDAGIIVATGVQRKRR